MPYQNFHTCRLKNPSLYQPDSFKTLHTKTKGLTLISGKLKETGKSETQSFRYDKKIWNKKKAEIHCDSRNGSFVGAVKKSKLFVLKKQGVDFDIKHGKVEELVKDAFKLKSYWKTLNLNDGHENWTKEDLTESYKKIIEVLKKKKYPFLLKKKKK